RHLFLAQKIVRDQDVVDPGVCHDLGLAELLAGDALRASGDLQLCEQRALVGLDMRPVGDAGCVTGRLDTGDVALDPVHVDDGAGRAVFLCDLGGEGCGHQATPIQYLVIASEAKQSMLPMYSGSLRRGVYHRAGQKGRTRWLLAMTKRTRLRLLDFLT